MRTSVLRVAVLIALGVGAATVALAEQLIVRTQKPYGTVKAQIAALGGTVTYEFKHAGGLVVTVPDDRIEELETIAGVEYTVRDLTVPNPEPREVADLGGELAGELPGESLPANYFPYNSELTNAGPLQTAGFLGQGVVVGIIDSGTANTASALCANPSTPANCAATSRVIGGENFVPGGTEPGANSSLNNPHGTWVATMIGANRVFGFASAGRLATAVRNYCTPASSSPCSFVAAPGVDGIPMVGQAPAAQFYALKVFPASGGGAPTSRVLQAMDRSVELKNTTRPDMKVVNMSLGGSTLFAGGDIEDELASSMAASGISLVVSAGNAGPSGSTGGSPGTARDILTIGAASSPVHERILRDLQFGTGIGALYRPDDDHQIALFSSRGPTADGRIDPEVVANGFASYAQGANGGISLVSGTSFSAPTVAGVVALLYSANPAATPEEIRSAVIGSANPSVVPTATAVEQGSGYVDAAAAKALLDAGTSPIADSGPAKKKLSQNVQQGAGIQPVNSSDFTTHLADLEPAERREVYYTVQKNTALVRVTLSNIAPELPPAQQNAFFGDDAILAVHSAKTSSIGDGDYLAFAFVAADQVFAFDRPETGLMRVTLLGDWTNAGRVSADLRIEEVHAPLPKKDFKGKMAEGELKVHTVSIPAGTAAVAFRLSWADDWGAYPTNDLDMILQSPSGVFNFTGATLDSPETATVTAPEAGTWTILVDGFTVFGKDDKYEVRVDY